MSRTCRASEAIATAACLCSINRGAGIRSRGRYQPMIPRTLRTLLGVSCPAAGACVATGMFGLGAGWSGMILIQSGDCMERFGCSPSFEPSLHGGEQRVHGLGGEVVVGRRRMRRCRTVCCGRGRVTERVLGDRPPHWHPTGDPDLPDDGAWWHRCDRVQIQPHAAHDTRSGGSTGSRPGRPRTTSSMPGCRACSLPASAKQPPGTSDTSSGWRESRRYREDASRRNGKGGYCTISLKRGVGSCSIVELTGSYTVTFTYAGDHTYRVNWMRITETGGRPSHAMA